MTESNSKLENQVEEPTIKLISADKGKRFVNYLVDRFVVLVLAMGIMMAYLATQDFYYEEDTLLDYVFSFITSLLYYSTFEAITGRSVGKYLTQTKVVTEEGYRPTYAQVLGRTLARFIPFEPFSFLGDKATGWHDRLSNTMVIDLKKSVLPEEEEHWVDDIIDANL